MITSDDGTRKQGSSAWCVRGRQLWKCCLEQLRHASSQELLLPELQEESQDTGTSVMWYLPWERMSIWMFQQKPQLNKNGMKAMIQS